MPKSAAQKIFENIEAGFPVLCYELSGTQSQAGVAQDKAYAVIDAISAIGTVTLDKESKIVNARNKYNALSSGAKSYVTNYKTLTNAEATLSNLKAAQQPVQTPTQTPTETPTSTETQVPTQTSVQEETPVETVTETTEG